MLKRLHDRIGDFWWYSLMVFCAARAADGLNIFVGLWLVPKYVSPADLGAVQPLSNFANFLIIPAAVFASTFRQEISNLAVRGEFGRMKSLMRGVFVVTAAVFAVALVAARFVLPAFLERIRIVEGSLGLVILAASFVGTASGIYTNPLQALRKFSASSVISILGAPVRLVAMLVAMPFRALTGYFAGQAAVPAFSIFASIFALRKELSVQAAPYWTRGVAARFGRLFAVFGVLAVSGGFASLVESTVIRQHMPEIESAAYYMVTRFSDIASFVACSFNFTLFPFAAGLAARGLGTNSLVLKSSIVLVSGNCVLAAFFWAFGGDVLAFLPHGEEYSAYGWAIPVMIGISTMNACSSFYFTAETSANRFGFMWFSVPLNLAYGAAILAVTGHGYYLRLLPDRAVDFLRTHNITSLGAIMAWMAAFAAIRLACCAFWALRGGRLHAAQAVVREVGE